MNAKNCRRKVKDRRSNDLKKDRAFPYNRRYRPCRRLNNILVSEVRVDIFMRHPSLWSHFRSLGYKNSFLKLIR
jgi:hypothetical protein